MNDRALTGKELAFANHVIDGENLTEARRKAGYSQRLSLRNQASDAQHLRNKPHISAMIEVAQAQIAEALAVSREDVAKELEYMGFARLTDWVEIRDGTLIIKDADSVPERALAALAEVVQHTSHREGEAQSSTLRIKLHDKRSSLEALSKLLGFDKEQPEAHKRVKVTRMTVRATETGEERTIDAMSETVEVEEGVPPIPDGADAY